MRVFKTRYKRLLPIFWMVILAFGLSGQQVQAQCTGCTTTLGTNTAFTFPSTGNKLCITSPTYSQTINFNWQSGPNSVCIANGVTFSGGYSNSNNTANIELYGVATTSTSMNFNTGGTLNFTIGSTGVYLGSLSVPNAGITSVAGIFNPISASLNQTGYSLVITPTGSATIPGGTLVSCAVNNQGNLFLGSGLTLNSSSTLTLGGTVVANGPINASSGQILITGNVTFNSGFTSTGTNLTVANGGSLNVNGNLFWNGGGTFSIGGAVNVNGNFQSNSNVAISDGSVNVTGVIQNSGGGFSGSGSGCGYVCGGTLTGWGNWNNGSGLSLCKSPTGGSSPGSGVSVYTTTTTSQPTALSVASTTTGFRGTFTVATNTGTNGYIVVRNTGSQPATPTSFRNYVAGTTVSGTTIIAAVITPRTTSSFIDIQPSGCGVTNYYAIYAFQNLTSAGTACGSNYYINTLNPATAQLAVGTLGTVGSITGVTTICGAGNLSFSTSTISGATGYIWGYTGQGVTVASTTTSAILTFSSTATSGIVTVAGFSSCGTTTSANLTLTITSAPTILSQPSSNTICGSGNAFYTVSTSGSGVSYAWQASSNSGTSWFNLSNGSPYSGVTTATLTVSSPPTSLSGYQFRSIISTSCATLTSNGANLITNNSGTWLGTVNTDWFNSSNWCTIPTTTANSAIIPAGTTFMPIITASSINIGGITLASGASLTISGSNTLTLSGNLINNGTIVPNSSTIVWNGSSAQTISGTGTNQFTNLSFRNTTGVTIGSTVSVSGTASFNTNARLTINSGATMVLQSSASGTARISAMPSGATITGNITMQRYVPAKPTVRLMSSAVNGATVADWKNSIPVSGIGGTGNGFDASVANINTVWYFNETINAPTTFRYVGAPNTSMALTPGAGYRVYVRGDRNFINLMGTITITNVTMGVTNRPNQGNISLPVSYSNYNAPFRDGTNLVGNPYPCEINWDAPGWTKTNIDNALYMWDPNLGTNGAYYYYVAGVASPARTNPGIIASSQGFFVKANAASPVLIATESVKTIAGHTANFRTSNEVPDVVRVQLKDQTGLFDELAVRFHPNATKAFDKDFDAFKIYNSNLNVFARPNTQSDLSINSFALDNNPYVLPVVVSASKKGNYTLAFSGLESISQPTDIYISDRYTASYAKLDEGSTYDITFNSDTSSTSLNRFALVFMRSSVTTGLEAAVSGAKPSVEIFPNPVNDNELHLNLYQWEGKSVAISIKNAAGQLLFNQQVKVENPFVSLVVPVAQQWAEGVYIIQCVGDGFQDTKKVIIQK